MTDMFRQMASVAREQGKAVRKFAESQPITALNEICASGQDCVTAFNALRATMVAGTDALNHFTVYMRGLEDHIRVLFSSSVEYSIRDLGGTPVDIETDDAFTRTFRDAVGDGKDLIHTMRACAKFRKRLTGRIGEWQGKIDKLGAVNLIGGSTASEADTAQVKALKLNSIVAALKSRKDIVDEAFWTAKRKLDKAVAAITERFEEGGLE